MICGRVLWLGLARIAERGCRITVPERHIHEVYNVDDIGHAVAVHICGDVRGLDRE